MYEDLQLIVVSAVIEEQIAELENLQERTLFLKEYGLVESGLSKLIKAAYKLLNLITYFTASPKEVRAWTIVDGWKAPQAAGVIHSDFERGFIKVEMIRLSDYKTILNIISFSPSFRDNVLKILRSPSISPIKL